MPDAFAVANPGLAPRAGYTIASMRAWADDKRHVLACNHLRRGFWKGEDTDHDVCCSLIALLDAIAADSVIMQRLKARAE